MRRLTRIGNLIATSISQVGILGHGLEVSRCAIAALEGGVGLGVHSEAPKAIARKHGGNAADSGDQKSKAETNGLLGGSGGDPHGVKLLGLD